MKAALFDLDDTLYPEMEFVRSGFLAVARHVSGRCDLGEQAVIERMFALLRRDGRGQVFDNLLRDVNLYSEQAVRTLLCVYRSHRPVLTLCRDAAATLGWLRQRGMRLGIVTDGMASVQQNKIAALGLEPMVDAVVCTDTLGPGCGKPSPVPYLVALDLLSVPPGEASYIGDNLQKDFLAPNRLGMLTIRVWRGETAAGPEGDVAAEARPSVSVARLSDILPYLEGGRSNA